MFLKKHFLKISLLVLLTLAISASFYRFIILKDYDVSYETDCDPYTQVCYELCEDEQCEEPYYYNYIIKHADDLYPICGLDITGCEEAFICLETDKVCEFKFCEPQFEQCESLTSDDKPVELIETTASELDFVQALENKQIGL